MFCKNERWIDLLIVKQEFGRNIYRKNIKIKILYKVSEGGTYSKNNKYKEEFFFLSFLYIKGLNIKMAAITKETYEDNGIEVITDKIGELWLNERHIQEQLGLKHLPALTNKYDEE